MSWEAKYNPLDPAVPNIVIAWNEVDLPTGNPNTINNPDTSQFGDPDKIHPEGITKVSGNAIVPLTALDFTRKQLFDGPASQAPEAPPSGNIKIIFTQVTLSGAPILIGKGVKFGMHLKWFASNGREAGFGLDTLLVGGSLDALNSPTSLLQFKVTESGDFIIEKLRGFESYDISIDATYL